MYTNPGFYLPSLKKVWDLVHPGKNRDVRKILRNLIGCLEDWELEKTGQIIKNRNSGLVYWILFSVSKINEA